MSQVPSFNFGKTKINLDEVKGELESAGKPSKIFQPGNYLLTIRNPRYHVHKATGKIECADDSWIAVSMDLVSVEGKSKFFYLTIPTDTPYWNSTGKKNLFKFIELQRFMAGLGISLTVDNMGEIIPMYFGSEQALQNLVGGELNVDIGFRGAHVKYNSENNYSIVINGEEYAEGGNVLSFPDADAAVVYAVNNLNGLRLERFADIIKIHPAEVKTEVKKKANDSW